MIQGVPALTRVKRDVPCSRKVGGSLVSVQVLDDPGCASFNTGVTRCSVFQKSRGFPKIRAGTG